MVGISKKIAFISVLCLSALCVYAEDNKAAVVDLQLVLEKASVIKSISNQSEKLESDAQQKYTLAEEKFNKDKDALLKNKDTMSEEAYEKKMDELSQNLMKAQNELQYQGSIISAARYAALSNVQNKIIEIVTNIAEKQKLGIVMSKGVALYSKKEVSQETIDELNKSMPDIKVDVESAKKKITNKQSSNDQQ